MSRLQPSLSWAPRHTWPVAFGMLALALRLVRLGDRSLWLDEAFSAWLAGQPDAVIVHYGDFHPPLYYLILQAWSALGSYAGTDAGLRLPSALASAAGVALAVWLLQRLRLPGPGLVGALSATSALSVWYAQEVRMYALAGLAVSLAATTLAIAASAARGRLRPSRFTFLLVWAVYVGSGAIACYLHYDAIPILAGLGALFVVSARRSGSAIVAWLVASCLVAILYLPQVPALLESVDNLSALHWAAKAGIVIAVTGILAAASTAIFLLARRHPSLRRPVALAFAIGGLLALDVAGLTTYGISVKRHVAIVLPAFIAVAGVTIATLRVGRRWQWFLVAAGLPALFLTLFVQQKEDWRGAAAVLAQNASPGDTYVFYHGYVAVGLERYWRADSPNVGAYNPGDLAPVLDGPLSQRRVWLVESHTQDPPSLGPYLAEVRRAGPRWALYRVTLQRFDPPPAAREVGWYARKDSNLRPTG